MLSAGALTATVKGRFVSWTTTRVGSGVGATTLLVRILSSAYDLLVEDITLYCKAASEVVIHCPTDATTALAGTDVTGNALDRDFSATNLAAAKGQETNLSQGTIIKRDYINATGSKTWDFGGSLVLSLGKSIGIDCVHNADDTIATIRGYFKVPSQ